MVNQKFFNHWVRRMSYAARKDSNITITQLNDRKSIVVMNLKNGKTAMSKCHPDDRTTNYNFDLGLAIAYARLLGQDVPEVDKRVSLSSLEAGEYFLYMGKKFGFTGFKNQYGGYYAIADMETTPRLTCFANTLVTPIEE